MYGASYQQELLNAIAAFLPGGFFLSGRCGAEAAGRHNA
jgi:hypothetical protein